MSAPSVINGQQVVYTDNPSVACTILPNHWRCNKALPQNFQVFILFKVPNETEVSLRASNEENANAELKNSRTTVSNGVATFDDLRFVGRSGRGKSLDVIITIHCSPPIDCRIAEVIKVTVDGPREPRRRRTIQHSTHKNSLANAMGHYGEAGTPPLDPVSELGVFDHEYESGNPVINLPGQHGYGDEIKPLSGVHRVRSRTLPVTIRRCQSAPYIPDLKNKRLSIASQGSNSGCPDYSKSNDDVRVLNEGTIPQYNSSPRLSHSNINMLKNMEEMRRLRSESLGSIHDFIDEAGVQRARNLSSDYGSPGSLLAVSPDFNLNRASSTPTLVPSPSPGARVNMNREFQFVSLSKDEGEEGDVCVATLKFANPENHTLHIMFGSCAPAFEDLKMGPDGTMMCYFKAPSRAQCGGMKRVEVAAFYRVNNQVIYGVGTHPFTYKGGAGEGGEIPEVKLNIIMLKLHLKNQQYQIQVHDQGKGIAESGPNNILRQIRPLEDKLFSRCVPVLTALGQTKQLPAVDAANGATDVAGGTGSVGLTVLHLAAEFGWIKFINQLIQSGADPNQKDLLGNSALDWAYMSDQEEAVQVITSFGGQFFTFAVQDMGETLSKMDMGDSSLLGVLEEFGNKYDLPH
eukprot:Nk52_evm4s2657 gene=Nk52_evmTU4s2657